MSNTKQVILDHINALQAKKDALMVEVHRTDGAMAAYIDTVGQLEYEEREKQQAEIKAELAAIDALADMSINAVDHLDETVLEPILPDHDEYIPPEVYSTPIDSVRHIFRGDQVDSPINLDVIANDDQPDLTAGITEFEKNIRSDIVKAFMGQTTDDGFEPYDQGPHLPVTTLPPIDLHLETQPTEFLSNDNRDQLNDRAGDGQPS